MRYLIVIIMANVFSMSAINTGAWLIHVAEKDSSKITQAQNANNAISANNDVETTQTDFNEQYLNYLSKKRRVKQSDVLHLEQLAKKCPTQYGTAVYQARTVLFDLTKKQYVNDCEKGGVTNNNRLAKATESVTQTVNIKLYPNPNNGKFIIETNNEQNYQLQVYNMLGVLVHTQNVSNNQEVNLQHLATATYVTKLVAVNGVITTNRITIIH